MLRKAHALAGRLAFLCMAAFWLSTVVAELFLGHDAIVGIKTAIPYAFIAFLPCMALAGATGFRLGGKSALPALVTKRRRMPFIGANGVLILIPAALFLAFKARAGEFDAWFYGVQTVELLAGAVNLALMGLNIRDGRALRKRRQMR